MRLIAIVPLLAFALSGCGNISPLTPYRMEIQQGNHLSQEKVSQLRRGMTKDQVRFLLGTPLLTDMFHGDRWDYLFRRVPESSNKVEARRLALFFVDGRLDHVEGDVVAASEEVAQDEAFMGSRP